MSTEDIVEMASILCPCAKGIGHDQSKSKKLSTYDKNHGIGVILLDDGMQVYTNLYSFTM